ncbi:MAG TPA: carboxymuconolactone decarboxylase family protein [Terriglobales bacterium]|nr:carboxymuconolactone decarboxylase family protein [Terriglobales bacterium]
MIAVLEGRLDDGGLTPAERALMDYVKLITENSARSTGEDVQKLRDAGWKEDQIAEAVYITAMFAFFNRVADAFGLAPQNYLVTGQLSP